MEESSAFPDLSAVYFLWYGGQGRWLVCREGLMRGVSGLMGKENETVFGQTRGNWRFRPMKFPHGSTTAMTYDGNSC